VSNFHIEITGDELAKRKLAQLALFLSDLRPFWPLVVPLFIGWMRQQFESEGAFGGKPWAPLTASTLAQKGSGKSILIDTGALRRAASSPRREASPRTLTLTIEDPKIEYHQEGTSKMVARPILFDDLPAAARVELQAVAEGYVRTLAARF
jgi:hypothetical protein